MPNELNVTPTKGSLIAIQKSLELSTLGFDLLDHFFHILHRVTVGNQHCIFGLHYHQIFHPDGGDQARFGIHIAVFSFVINHIAVANVALGGVGADFP